MRVRFVPFSGASTLVFLLVRTRGIVLTEDFGGLLAGGGRSFLRDAPSSPEPGAPGNPGKETASKFPMIWGAEVELVLLVITEFRRAIESVLLLTVPLGGMMGVLSDATSGSISSSSSSLSLSEITISLFFPRLFRGAAKSISSLDPICNGVFRTVRGESPQQSGPSALVLTISARCDINGLGGVMLSATAGTFSTKSGRTIGEMTKGVISSRASKGDVGITDPAISGRALESHTVRTIRTRCFTNMDDLTPDNIFNLFLAGRRQCITGILIMLEPEWLLAVFCLSPQR